MFYSAGITQALCSSPFAIVQMLAQLPTGTPEGVALKVSGPEFAIALIVGVVLAFAFQLLLTEFFVAAGISYMGSQADSDNESGSVGKSMSQIGAKLGFLTLISVCIALFAACWLAAQLSLLSSEMLGAIFGLTIWATYFCLLFWVSSTTVGSLIGGIVKMATSGVQSIAGTAGAALGAKAVNSQIASAVETSIDAVRHQLSATLDPEDMRERLEDYFAKLRPQELELGGIRGQFEKLINSEDVKAIAQSGNFPTINRQTFVDLVRDRTDISKRDVNRIVEQLEDAWTQAASSSSAPAKDVLADLTNYLKSANPEELRKEFNNKLNQLISEFGSKSNGQNPSIMAQAGKLGLNALVGIVLGRTDLSDIDVEKIISQVQTVKDQLGSQADKIASGVGIKTPEQFNTIRADVENYLSHKSSWQITPETIKQEFKDVIYDAEADPGTVKRQLEPISRADIVKFLSDRGVFTQDKIAEIANEIEEVRKDVLSTVSAAEEQHKTQDFRSRVEEFLRSTGKEELNPEGIGRDFKKLLEDPNAGLEQLRDRLGQFDRDTLVQLLSQRQDFSPEEADKLVGEIEGVRDRVISEAQELADQANAKLTELRQKIESYLRSTGKEELNPEGIKNDLKTLLDDPQAGLQAIRARLSDFDRDTLVQLLSQRQDLSEEQINQVIEQVQSLWSTVLHAPQNIADKSKEQYDKITNALGEYLRNTGKEQLNPEGIKQDLAKLLEDPKQGALALRDRLSGIDRDTLVKLLSQRQDLSEEEVNQIIDRVQDTIRSIVKAPRRFAKRVQTQVMDFEATLEDYLRNTGKEELNPEAIKRDLQQLINDPKGGAANLGDRLSHFDRSTIVALLSQRQDISEEEANQIVDRILSVRDQFVEQLQNVQHRMQGITDGIMGQVRNSLNSLNRPELNYESIKEDMRKLFDDPQAGFEALRDRLGQFDRDTLVAIISSREDISEADANQIIDQIDQVRHSVLHRAERLQHKVQDRMAKIKHQALEQAEETREAAASAAWWLFGTAFTSAAVSAIAGMMAVGGFGF